MPHQRVRPVRVRERDAALTVTIVRGVGFRGECDCGWRGRKWWTWRAAALEVYWHRGGCAG